MHFLIIHDLIDIYDLEFRSHESLDLERKLRFVENLGKIQFSKKNETKKNRFWINETSFENDF